MRALADAVLVGSGTVRHDDPQLTVRRVAGQNPLRVVIDAHRRLPADRKVFRDGAAETLVVCTRQAANAMADNPGAALLPLPAVDGSMDPAAICDALTDHGIRDRKNVV